MDSSKLHDISADVAEVRVVIGSEGSHVRTPIWIVTADGTTYVRSYKATAGKWYQHVRASPSFVLEIAGEDVPVTAEPVTDAAVLDAVDRAYLSKYAGAEETPDMVTPDVRRTTLRVRPAG